MFNTIRSSTAPSCLNKKQYNTKEVVDKLEPMFFGKCYLCEQDELSSPEIEHFDPHQGNQSKKFDWDNLYYSCDRCNSIKGTKHKNLLDCCDPLINVFKIIRCTMPSIPDEDIKVSAMIDPSDQKTKNTVELLNLCYNEDNTALRGITRSVLIEKLYEHYTELLKYRLIIKDKRSTGTEKEYAKERIESMLKESFPFSVFWRWHVISDKFLKEELKDKINF